MRTSPPPSLVLDDQGFRALVAALMKEHRTIAPQVRDDSIVLAELNAIDDMASGVTLEQDPGSCCVTSLAPGDDRRFAWAVGPHSAKAIQHPAEQLVFTGVVDGDGFRVSTADHSGSSDASIAIVGLRPCDVAAIDVLGRVIDGPWNTETKPFVVVVNCAEPGGCCFCVSMNSGPALTEDRLGSADLVLWERGGGEGPEYLVTHASTQGRGLLADLDTSVAMVADADWATETEDGAAMRMGRRLNTDALAERLAATLESARWDVLGQRCLSCGNCTMVCPTCFCSSLHDTSSFDGSHVARTQRWDTCFSLEHSFVHGGSVRSNTSDRYRQWLTHKLSSWWAQFGESGCVGCGRCIAWCPVGIDLVEEANALADEAEADAETEASGAVAPSLEPAGLSVTEVLVRRRAMARGEPT